MCRYYEVKVLNLYQVRVIELIEWNAQVSRILESHAGVLWDSFRFVLSSQL